MTHQRFLLWVLLLLPWLPRSAQAASGQVVVLETRVSGEVPAAERTRLAEGVWAALDRLKVPRITDADREAVLGGEADLRGCLGKKECLERLGRLLAASHVLAAQVARESAGYRMQVRLFNVDVGDDGANLDWRCQSCDGEEAVRRLDALVERAVKEDLARPRATLVVRSTPTSADVQIDGRAVGFTELERTVFAGTHDVLVSARGLQPSRMRIEISDRQRMELSFSPGERQRFDAPKKEQPQPAPRIVVVERPASQPPPRRSRWKLGVGIPLLGIGLAGIGVGAGFLAVDNTCADSPCTRLFETRTPGVIGLAAGGALSVAGLALIIADVVEGRRHARQPR